ncbi:DUF7693 family protein [Pseudomonas kielensis]|uniref:DUF7693 family protein n=1 Tax=Pseudomonas kielensis TaxID=2762577 RepID=UPI001FD03ECE|nr:hypothetical protein [Pseudomonas kielensis]
MDTTQRVPGRAYQTVRDPERLLIEERAEALSAAGYPLPNDDPAMYAEQRLKEARAAARSSQLNGAAEEAPLSTREVSQVLREVALGRLIMVRACERGWEEIYAERFKVNVEGWRMSIHNDRDELGYCEECISPDGRRWSIDSGNRFGTDPIAMLSTWEHQTLERLLKAI